MADNIDILEKVKSLGLNSYEAKVYLALFERESLSVNEIAKISNVPRARVYDTLDSLMAEGLASMKPGKLKKYSAAAPELLQEKLEHKIETQYKAQKETLASTVLTLKRTYEARRENGFDDSNPLDYIEVLRNPLQIHRKFIELFSKAEKEVLIFYKPPFAWWGSDKDFDKQKQVQDEATKRGVITRGIYEMPPENQVEEFFNHHICKPERNQGDGLKVIDKLPIKLNIYDDKACFFAMVDPIKERTSLTMLVAEHEALILSFRMLFESIWEKAKNYYYFKGKKYYLTEDRDDEENDE